MIKAKSTPSFGEARVQTITMTDTRGERPLPPSPPPRLSPPNCKKACLPLIGSSKKPVDDSPFIPKCRPVVSFGTWTPSQVCPSTGVLITSPCPVLKLRRWPCVAFEEKNELFGRSCTVNYAAVDCVLFVSFVVSCTPSRACLSVQITKLCKG